MKNFLLVGGLLSAIIWSSCGTNVLERPDPDVQAATDSAIIINYLSDIGLLGQDSMLENGVHFVILDEGDSLQIEDSDIVTFDFTGKLLNDTIFDTSIQPVGDSILREVQADTAGITEISNTQLALLNSFPETRTYSSIEFTYTPSGWTLGANTYIAGFSSGITAALNGLQVGGSALIVIPSRLAYGVQGTGILIPPNTVVAFEIYPVEVKKQR
ncbi:MAG: FKBP-type peptidyl-prolyl cis-trans isomerase [Bacteroidota bacterium]